MPSVLDIMSTDLVIVERTATVAEAATVMGERGVGSALVIEEGRAAGIFTERDILRALGSDFDAARHLVDQWMTPDPITVDAATDVSLARDLMLRHGFRHLPVTDGDSLAGIVSIRDLSRIDD